MNLAPPECYAAPWTRGCAAHHGGGQFFRGATVAPCHNVPSLRVVQNGALVQAPASVLRQIDACLRVWDEDSSYGLCDFPTVPGDQLCPA